MHNIQNTNGKANIAYAGETPWHNLGQKIENAFDAETALREANLDWEVETAPLYYDKKEWGDPTIPMSKSERAKVVLRKDNGVELGVVGPSYVPLQNKEAFAFFDGVFGKGNARYEAAGYLGQGERMWLLANLDDNEPIEILPGDVIKKYLLLTNDHTGNYAVLGGLTPIRVICGNTCTAATSKLLKETGTIRVKHVGDVANRLHFAGEILAKAGVFYDEVKHLFQAFASKQLNGEQTRNYIHGTLFDDPKRTKSRAKTVDTVEGLMHTGRGSDIAGVRGTVWGAYNAVTEYVDHEKEFRGGDLKRIEASQFGTGRTIKAKALQLGTELVNGNNSVELN